MNIFVVRSIGSEDQVRSALMTVNLSILNVVKNIGVIEELEKKASRRTVRMGEIEFDYIPDQLAEHALERL